MLSPASAKQLFRIIVVTSLCVVGLLVPQSVYCSGGDTGAEDLIRSAMIYNFCKFVQWPGGEQETLILGILSPPGSYTDFSSIEGKMVHDASIEIRRVSSMEEMKGCHLVFIAEGQTPILDEAFAVGQNESILTISEMDNFCTQGGIIQLVHRRGKLRFFINRRAATESQLVLSSQLLKMAKIVEGD